MSMPWSGGLGAPGASVGSLWNIPTVLPPAEAKRARRFLLVTGILSLLAGVAAIIVPIVASVTMTLFVGWVLMFYGVVSLVRSIRTEAPRSTKAWHILNAALAFLVGLYLVALPLTGTLTLTFLLCVWLFGSGAYSLVSAAQHWGQENAGWLVLNGVLSLVVGALIIADLPSSAGWAIGLWVGVYMLWWGMDALMAASLLKRAEAAR